MLPEKRTSVIGMDLHTNRFNICHLASDGTEKRKTYQIPEGLGDFMAGLTKEDVVVMEASTNSFRMAHLIRSQVKQAYVVDPHSLATIHQTSKKTDAVDATKIAKAGMYHERMDQDHLPLVTVPDEKMMELRSLFTTYKKTVGHMTSVVNQIHAKLKALLLPFNGKNLASQKVRDEIAGLEMPWSYSMEIRLLYKELDALQENKEMLTELICKHAKFYPEEIALILSLPGMSVMTALALKADYIDISRFANKKKFASYMRVAPAVDQSNEQSRPKGLNKRSRKLGLSFVLQGLSHFYHSSPRLKEYREEKKKGKPAGEVQILMARKLLDILFSMLKNKELYRGRDIVAYNRKLKELDRIKTA